MIRQLTLALCLILALGLPALAQQSSKEDKSFDVRSSIGDLHVGKDATAEKAGLPLYPGARPKHEDESEPLNFALLTESVGLKLIVAKYESDDAPAKVIAFYRDKLKKYGKVLECHSQSHGGDVEVHDSKDSDRNKEVKCDDSSGPVTELKVGTEDNQRVVAVEPGDKSRGSAFAIVYVYNRGERGDI